MGGSWNSYNHYGCHPDEAHIKSNAQALVDLGLSQLGYKYVTVDCGWTVPDRLSNGTLTWNTTLFPNGFIELGQFIHSLNLLFGVYGDSGIKTCGGPPDQAGSLCKRSKDCEKDSSLMKAADHEDVDAQSFASWGADALKCTYGPLPFAGPSDWYR
jgi:alpha-galactosidase